MSLTILGQLQRLPNLVQQVLNDEAAAEPHDRGDQDGRADEDVQGARHHDAV